MLDSFQIDPIILAALKEDMPYGDPSTDAIYPEYQLATVDLLAKQAGILAGSPIFMRVFTLLDEDTIFHINHRDGDEIQPGDILMTVEGDVRTLLKGERVALNFLQRMSGIATRTHSLVTALNSDRIKVMDTRKTTPNLRLFEKYAVKVGFGENHRMSLSDVIMLKDNHVAAAGGVKEAIEAYTKLVEVETETLDMVKQAVEAGADIIMLDNMANETIKQAIDIIDGRAIIEVSGNITEERLPSLSDLAIDYVSSGSLTHSAGILDLSMKNLSIIG